MIENEAKLERLKELDEELKKLDENFTPNGKFARGNKLGRGRNPKSVRTERLRVAMMASVSPEDIFEIMTEFIEAAKNGNISAAREVLDRAVGKTEESVLVKRLEELETAILEGQVEFEDA